MGTRRHPHGIAHVNQINAPQQILPCSMGRKARPSEGGGSALIERLPCPQHHLPNRVDSHRKANRHDRGPLYPGSACSRSSRMVRKNRSTGPLSRPVRNRAGWIEIPIRWQTLVRCSETKILP